MKLLPTLLVVSTAALWACASTTANTCSSSDQALTVCAASKVVKGVDVSVFQGSVSWSKVKAAGVDFAFARVSDGTATVDSTFATNWKGMKANGIVRGVYQFFEPGGDPTKQADLVLNQVKNAGGFEATDLPPVMDIETTGGQSDATLQANMKTWLTVIQNAIGRKPLIYTNLNTASHFGGKFTGYPLWVASWGASCPTMPSGWKAWKFWQYTDSGSVNGISGGVDRDEFDGTLADLEAWANPSPPPVDGGVSDAGARSADASAPATDAGDAPASEPDASAPVDPCAP